MIARVLEGEIDAVRTSVGDAVDSVNSTSFQSSPESCWMSALYSTCTLLRSAAARMTYDGDQPQLFTR